MSKEVDKQTKDAIEKFHSVMYLDLNNAICPDDVCRPRERWNHPVF